MRNRGQIVIGGLLVLFGLLSLFSSLFHIDLGAICWPVGLIGVGVWLVFRPRLGSADHPAEVMLIGDMKRRGNWPVRSEEFWLGIGDAELDFTATTVPSGQTDLRIYTLVSEVHIFIPRTVGVAVQVNGFIIDADLLGQKHESIFSPAVVESENFKSADCRLSIEIDGFVADVKVKQV